MGNELYKKLKLHIGHDVCISAYGDMENIALECEDCNEIIIDTDCYDVVGRDELDTEKADFGNGFSLNACRYSCDGLSDELSIYVTDACGAVVQDICCVRAGSDNKHVECFVWEDEYDEDYTRKFDIKLYDCDNED